MVMSSWLSSLEPRESGTVGDAATAASTSTSMSVNDASFRSPERSPELSSPPASFGRLTMKRPDAAEGAVLPAASGSGENSEEPWRKLEPVPLQQEEHSGKGKQPPVVTDAMPVGDARAPPGEKNVSHLEAAGETRKTAREPGEDAVKDGLVGSSERTREAAGGGSVVTKEESERRYGGEVGGGERPHGESDRRRAANDARIESDRRDDAKCDRSDADVDGEGRGKDKGGIHRDSDKPLSAPVPVQVQAALGRGTAKSIPDDSLVVLNERQPTERVPKVAGEEAEGGRDEGRNGPRKGVPGMGSGVGGGPICGAANGGGENTSCPRGKNGKPPMEKSVAIGSDKGEGTGAGDTVDLSSSGAGEGGRDGRPLLHQQQHVMGVSQSMTDVENLPPPSLLRSTSKYLHEDLAEAKRKQNQRARAKRHKKISFADEHGDALHMTHFHQVLYYSKDGVPTPNGRGCCTIA